MTTHSDQLPGMPHGLARFVALVAALFLSPSPLLLAALLQPGDWLYLYGIAVLGGILCGVPIVLLGVAALKIFGKRDFRLRLLLGGCAGLITPAFLLAFDLFKRHEPTEWVIFPLCGSLLGMMGTLIFTATAESIDRRIRTP